MQPEDSTGRKKFLFLFTELAGYIVACLKQLSDTYPVEVHVVRWPVNQVAPFQFSLEGNNIHFYERHDFDEAQLLDWAVQFDPDVIFCSGWIDKGYVKICKHFVNKVPTILTFDNPWRNTLKQNIASLIGPLYLRRYYSACWVSGAPQKKYALKLGFNEKIITEGYYSCDFSFFHNQYHLNREEKLKDFPKKIIFVGRYTKLKGVTELWEAFMEFLRRYDTDWELWCLGKGELEKSFPVHDKIKNFGFVQPTEMPRFIRESGVFILPSHYEHWGVAVHEFAAAGFPLVCSDSTGAATAFLKDEYNGFLHKPCSVRALVDVFRRISKTPVDELVSMGDRSAEMASVITPETWCSTAMNHLKN